MHFMVRVDEETESHLVTPSEVDGGAGGEFFVPLTDDGELFPVYQFHYSVYLGNGEYFPNKEGRESFHGFAATLPTERRTHLLMTFGLIDRSAELWLPREFWGPPFFWVDLPRALRSKGELLFPILRRIPRRSPLRYGGKAQHKDFKHSFAELEAMEPKLFDRLLDEFHISIIGFDRKVRQAEKF
jgi:hypothetical protein